MSKDPKMSFRTHWKERLTKRTIALLQTLEEEDFQGKDWLVGQRVSLLLQAAIHYSGPQVLANVAKSFDELVRARDGYCITCVGDPRRADTSENDEMCDVCRSQANKGLEGFE